MAKFVSKNATVLLGGVDLAAFTNNVSVGVMAKEQECTNFASDGWEEFLARMRGSQVQLAGYNSNADVDNLIADMATTPTPQPFAATLTRPAAASDVAYFGKLLLKNYRHLKPLGQLFGFAADLVSTQQLARGIVLESVTRTSTANGTELEIAAIGSGEFVAVATFVTAVSGTNPTLDNVIQSDTVGFASATNRITVPQFTAIGANIQFLAGPITDTYWRVSSAVGGTGSPSFTVVTVIGRVPVPS